MSQDRFFNLLATVPRIQGFWNQEKKELNVDLFESSLGVMSPAESHMAKFFASLWFHNNSRYGFDLIDAVSSLDSHNKGIILEWLSDPFWP